MEIESQSVRRMQGNQSLRYAVSETGPGKMLLRTEDVAVHVWMGVCVHAPWQRIASDTSYLLLDLRVSFGSISRRAAPLDEVGRLGVSTWRCQRLSEELPQQYKQHYINV